jgi:hypothetical protein
MWQTKHPAYARYDLRDPSDRPPEICSGGRLTDAENRVVVGNTGGDVCIRDKCFFRLFLSSPSVTQVHRRQTVVQTEPLMKRRRIPGSSVVPPPFNLTFKCTSIIPYSFYRIVTGCSSSGGKTVLACSWPLAHIYRVQKTSHGSLLPSLICLHIFVLN